MQRVVDSKGAQTAVPCTPTRVHCSELVHTAPSATRALLTVIVIFLVFAGVVGVLWLGARDVRNGVMTAGELVQFVIYAVLVAGAVGSLSEIWGELQRAAGATVATTRRYQPARRVESEPADTQ